jgi:hypothetical protein
VSSSRKETHVAPTFLQIGVLHAIGYRCVSGITLVDQDDLEVALRLPRQRVEQPHDRRRAIARGDHNREEVPLGEHGGQ